MRKITVCAALAVSIFSSCKKGDGGGPSVPVEKPCRLSEVSFSGGGTDSVLYTFKYSSGVLAEVTMRQGSTTNVRSFQRAGNTILVKPGGSAIADSVFLNDDGLIRRHRYRQYIASGLEEITEYAYAGTEVYRKVFARFQNASPIEADTTYYQWSLGNLFREIHDGVTTEYAYYTDRPIPPSGGDFFQLRTLLLQGAPVVKNTHFVSAMQLQGGSTSDIVSYEFDVDGKVTRMSGADGTYRFRYSCN